jgi:2',3'-cyclic-nucleotide 2'-phosphodiesterase (5'-nucleotidase family)
MILSIKPLNMYSKKLIYIVILFAFSTSCSHKTWTITNSTSTKIAIDKNTNATADKNYIAYLQPIKQKVDVQMDEVIGVAAETMTGHAPESLLSNFSADVYRQAATDYMGTKVDISIVNLGGLRTVINTGNITVRKVFELMPFENELVVIWLKGDKLMELLQYFASMGGEGVSGLRMEIKNGKAVNITIGGNKLDNNQLYSIATNDYLAGGNDKMVQLAQYEKRVNSGVKVRTVLLNFIKSETKKGNKIQSKLDGRVTPNP